MRGSTSLSAVARRVVLAVAAVLVALRATGGAVPLAGLVALVALGSAGCSVPLSGLNDVALEFAAPPHQPGTSSDPVGDLADRVKARLDAAQITADVSDAPGRAGAARVVLDADASAEADAILTWAGGIALHDVDGAYPLDPSLVAGLVSRAVARDGGIDRYWEGTEDQVSRVVRAAKLDERHRLFGERLPGGRWRTRVVLEPAWTTWSLADGTLASVSTAAHGRALAVTLGEKGRAALAGRQHGPSSAEGEVGAVAFVLGSSLISTVSEGRLTHALATGSTAAIDLPLGDDLGAFERAYGAERLLESPALPPLRRVSSDRLPPRYGVAAASALLPLLVSLTWLLFVRRFDRARPEPWWLVLVTFAAGALSVLPALFLELGFAAVSPWLDPSLVTLGGQLWSLPIAWPVFSLVVGMSEETSKLAAAWTAARGRPEFDEPVDGIVYACTAALGFAAAENVKYFALGRMSAALIALRSFVTVPAHMFFSALWGYALGRSLVSRHPRVFGWLALAALAHGAFDALVSIDGTQLLAMGMVLPLGMAFFVMLRLLLRHGAVRRPRGDAAPMTEPLPGSALERMYFRIGYPAAFYGCAAAMIATGCALMALGAGYEAMHHRVGPNFVAAASALLGAFAVAGYGATATIPLDVAVDAQGVTFAGARQPWGAVFDVDIVEKGRRSYVILRSPRGDLRLGPTAARSAYALAAAIRDVFAR